MRQHLYGRSEPQIAVKGPEDLKPRGPRSLTLHTVSEQTFLSSPASMSATIISAAGYQSSGAPG